MFPSKITVDSVGQNGHEQDSLTIQNMTRSHRQRLNIDLAPPKLHYSQEYLQLLELLDRSLLHQLPIQLSVCCCYRQLPHHTSHATHTPLFFISFSTFSPLFSSHSFSSFEQAHIKRQQTQQQNNTNRSKGKTSQFKQ